MRYYYEPSDEEPKYGITYYCGHPLFDLGTLFTCKDFGLILVRLKYDKLNKSFSLGPLDPHLAHEIYTNPDFEDYFAEHAKLKTLDGYYPVENVRKIMWALRMKPLRKEDWEKELNRLI